MRIRFWKQQQVMEEPEPSLPMAADQTSYTGFPLTARKKGSKADIIPTAALMSFRGQTILRLCKELDDEHIEVQVTEKETRKYFTHVKPALLAIDPKIFKSPFVKGWRYARIHYIVGQEPLTRDLYTGGIVDQEKKYNKLLERGVLIRHSGQEARQFYPDMVGKSPTGFFIHPDFVAEDKEGVPWEVFDVSDIDAIVAEVKQAEDSEVAKGFAKAAMEEFDKDPYAILGYYIAGFMIVFMIIVLGMAFFMAEIAKGGQPGALHHPLRYALATGFQWVKVGMRW